MVSARVSSVVLGSPRVLTPSSPVEVLVSIMRSNRYRLGAEEGHIPGKGEKHTPLGSENNSDRHVVQNQI
jgi:hypothetical protein